MLRSKKTWLAGALAGMLAFASCLGPNHATGHMFKWNGEIGNRWGRSIVFILVFPAYIITYLGDVLIFNSIQWWSGDNPISDPAEHINLIEVGDGPALQAEPKGEEVSR